MGKQHRSPRFNYTKEKYEEDVKKSEVLSQEEEMFLNFQDYDEKHPNWRMEEQNQKARQSALVKAKLAIEVIKSNSMPVTAVSVAEVARIARSTIYKNPEIKKLIDDCKEYNDDLKFMQQLLKKNRLNKSMPVDSPLTNYQLHLKLMEAYVHEYQLLKAMNDKMEEKIDNN